MELKNTEYEVDAKGIAIIWLNRPQRMNAWTGRLHTEYRYLLQQARHSWRHYFRTRRPTRRRPAPRLLAIAKRSRPSPHCNNRYSRRRSNAPSTTKPAARVAAPRSAAIPTPTRPSVHCNNTACRRRSGAASIRSRRFGSDRSRRAGEKID